MSPTRTQSAPAAEASAVTSPLGSGVAVGSNLGAAGSVQPARSGQQAVQRTAGVLPGVTPGGSPAASESSSDSEEEGLAAGAAREARLHGTIKHLKSRLELANAENVQLEELLKQADARMLGASTALSILRLQVHKEL